MRTLSAIGFVISMIGLLLASYNQFGVVPFLKNLDNTNLQVTEYTISLRQSMENTMNTLSMLCVIIGVFSVIFCSLLYLGKSTRMTLIGTIVGVVVTVMGVIHLFF